MKTMIDLKLVKDLENDDILVYRDGSWVNIRKNEYVAHLIQPIEALEHNLKQLTDRVEELEKLVKELRGED